LPQVCITSSDCAFDISCSASGTEADGVNNAAAAGDVAVVVVTAVAVAAVAVAAVAVAVGDVAAAVVVAGDGAAAVVVAPPLPPDGVAEAEAGNVAGLPVEAVLDLAAVIDGSVRTAADFGAEETEEAE
jgi:hypothetical protein